MMNVLIDRWLDILALIGVARYFISFDIFLLVVYESIDITFYEKYEIASGWSEIQNVLSTFFWSLVTGFHSVIAAMFNMRKQILMAEV